jgi:hypothetical protein
MSRSDRYLQSLSRMPERTLTEKLEDGVRVYYFDGYNATVEGASVARIDKG